MDNPVLTAFGALDILQTKDLHLRRVVVEVDGAIVGEISPERDGVNEMAYAHCYRGVTRGRDGVTPIGPTFDPAGMKRRLISVMFNGDPDAFGRARVKLAPRSF